MTKRKKCAEDNVELDVTYGHTTGITKLLDACCTSDSRER